MVKYAEKKYKGPNETERRTNTRRAAVTANYEYNNNLKIRYQSEKTKNSLSEKRETINNDFLTYAYSKGENTDYLLK